MSGQELSFGEYLKNFYKSVGPTAERDPEIQELLKADDRYDFGSTDYFNPVYSMLQEKRFDFIATDSVLLIPINFEALTSQERALLASEFKTLT